MAPPVQARHRAGRPPCGRLTRGAQRGRRPEPGAQRPLVPRRRPEPGAQRPAAPWRRFPPGRGGAGPLQRLVRRQDGEKPVRSMIPSDYVFVSYSRHDGAFVDRLSADLQRAGIQLWRDIEQIAAGSRWEQAIVEGLTNATALLFVSSRHSTKSAWMQRELLYFVEKKEQRIIPLIVDDAGADELPLILRPHQWVDFRVDYDVGFRALLSALKGVVSRGSPVEPKPRQSRGYVFISYAEEDSDFVGDLRLFLRERGYAYWDYDESDRDYHSQFFRELESVIADAAATLSILSESWKGSQWTIREYFFSQEVGTPVFLLRAKELGPTLAIAGVPYIDFVKDRQRGFEKLDRELKRKNL